MRGTIEQFDFWYAVNNTDIVMGPSRALETFGTTRVNYHLIAELDDDPHKIRIREGRLEANRPAIITPEAYMNDSLEGFGEEARKYFEFLKEHEDSIRILQYGYCLKQEAFTEQIVTDTISAVLDRVEEEVRKAGDPFSAVIKGVDNPWDVCLVKFFWMHVNNSAPVNIRELEKARTMAMNDSISFGEKNEVERAFARAERDPSLVRDLGHFLKARGVFEKYQDRFFKLVSRG